jgi:hypothetical protein
VLAPQTSVFSHRSGWRAKIHKSLRQTMSSLRRPFLAISLVWTAVRQASMPSTSVIVLVMLLQWNDRCGPPLLWQGSRVEEGLQETADISFYGRPYLPPYPSGEAV